MKPIATSFFFLFTATLCLALLLQSFVANASTDLIEEVCTNSHDKDNCVASLESNPDSKQANLAQLGIIALRLASSNATDTSSHIKQLLSNRTLDPTVEQALTDCSDHYLDAIEQLDDSIAALLANAYNDVHTWVQAAISDAESCEDGFKDGHESMLTSRNAIFRQLCNNALAINKLLAQK